MVGTTGNGTKTDPYLLTVTLDEVIELEIKTSPVDFTTQLTFELLKIQDGELINKKGERLD